MLLRINSENPQPHHIEMAAVCLKNGGIIIYPTDTVYGLACDLYKPKAMERICKIKNIKPEKANFSFIFYDLSHLSDFTRPVDTRTYKLMKKTLPGPFTFILEANSSIPKLFNNRKKTIGIRIPDNPVARGIVRELGNPFMSTSIHDEDDIVEYTTDPEEIYDKYKTLADVVIDGGYGHNVASTVIDCTNDQISIIRQGAGIIDGL